MLVLRKLPTLGNTNVIIVVPNKMSYNKFQAARENNIARPIRPFYSRFYNSAFQKSSDILWSVIS